MNKTTLTMFITFLLIVLVGVTATYVTYKYINKDNVLSAKEEAIEEAEEVDKEKEKINTTVEDVGITRTVNDYQFKDEFGSGEKMVTVKAVECQRLSGFTGASANVYCVTGNKELIHLELVNLTQKVVSTNIDNIEANNNGILAYYVGSYNQKIEDGYVTYVEKN